MSKSSSARDQLGRRRLPESQPAASQHRAALLREAEEILATVRVLWRVLLRNPYADAEAFGMTGPQVAVMACLVSRGPITLTELSRTLGMSHSSTSGIIDRLQARGLVRRAEDTTDKRRTPISVTEGVTRYVRELQKGPAGRLVSALEGATPAQRAAISDGLKSLCDLLGISRGSPKTRRGR